MSNQTAVKDIRLSKAVLVLILLALLSFVPAAFSLNREVGLVSPSGLEIRAAKFKKQQNNGQAALQGEAPTIAPGIEPLEFLPPQIEGYLMGARHPIAGEKYSAEAFYQPDTQQAKLIAPFNSHVRISYLPSRQEAKKSIELSLERYPVRRKQLKLGDLIATESYEADQQGYFIGWTVDEYAVEVDSSFTRGKHPGATGQLVNSGRDVAVFIDKFIREKQK